MTAPRRFVLVTGMAGAGLSTTLKSLEDLGYEVLDNLPLFLIGALLRERESRDRPLAIGIDSRTRDFTADRLLTRLTELRAQPGVAVQLIYVDADDDVLVRRFMETRRRHPLASDRPVIDGIHNERAILEPLKAAADVVIDTSDLSIHDTRRIVGGHFGLENKPALGVFVTSFSYRKGLPLMVLALADNRRELALADAADVPLMFEAFADRAYLPDGQLAPRRLAGAVHHEPQRILDQALAIARGEPFPDIDGNPLRLRADSLCVHGDNPESLAVLRRLRGLLDAA